MNEGEGRNEEGDNAIVTRVRAMLTGVGVDADLFPPRANVPAMKNALGIAWVAVALIAKRTRTPALLSDSTAATCVAEALCRAGVVDAAAPFVHLPPLSTYVALASALAAAPLFQPHVHAELFHTALWCLIRVAITLAAAPASGLAVARAFLDGQRLFVGHDTWLSPARCATQPSPGLLVVSSRAGPVLVGAPADAIALATCCRPASSHSARYTDTARPRSHRSCVATADSTSASRVPRTPTSAASSRKPSRPHTTPTPSRRATGRPRPCPTLLRPCPCWSPNPPL